MTKKRLPWILLGTIVLLAILVSGFALAQSSAEDILVQTLEKMETIEDAHAVVELSLESVEKNASGTVEVWGRKGQDGPGALRVEVLESSEADAAGAVFVSDGETVWAYKPAEGQVIVGTVEEAKTMLEERYAENGEYGHEDFDKSEVDHPEDAEGAVAKLLEYFTVEKKSAQSGVAGVDSAQLLELQPIPEQMPGEYMAVGGYINLWVDEGNSLPFAVAYTGGSMGEFSATAYDITINTGLDDALFAFEIPAGVEVLGFEDLQPQSLSLEEAAGSAEFQLLTASQTPEGATLVDVLEVRGTIVQRYTLPDGGSFTVAQGTSDEAPQPSADAQSVEVRGVSGSLYTSEDGGQVLLTWSEGSVFYYVAGDLSAEQALMIAKSLQ